MESGNNPIAKKNAAITKARQLPSGAEFRRCALQVNPVGYGSKFRGQSNATDAETHARAVVDKAADMDVSVLAITNHNDVSGVPVFRDAAARRGIKVFPGFELTSSEGIHILCIYPLTSTESELGRFLGEFGIRKTVPSSKLSSQSFPVILRSVRDQGGITIAAHVTSDKGLFRVLDGQAQIKAWRTSDLLAIQIPKQVKDLHQRDRMIVQNKNPDYCRDLPVSEELAIAVVNANDIMKSEDLDAPSATCWIKMSEISIEGLRQAFLDPGSRIRLNPQEGELESENHAELVAMAWEGGFLDGTGVHFNQNLNVLLGGRGAGKSTVIESVRYVLGLEAIGEDARKAHQGIVRQVLCSGTKISLLAKCIRPRLQKYTIERTVPNPPVVRDENGQLSNLPPEEVIPRVEVYGQHEISELTNSPEKLTQLLNRFVEGDASLDERKAEIRRDLEKNRRSIVDVRDELGQIDDRLATLPALEETLERYRQAGLEARLHEQSLLVREEGVLDSIPERMRTFDECLGLLRQEIPIDRAFLSQRALSDLPGGEILADANEVLENLNNEIEQIANVLEDSLRRANAGIDSIKSRWNVRKREVQEAYEHILRELQKSAVDGEEFIRLRREIERLQPLRQRQSQLQRSENEHMARRRALLAEWEDLKAEEFRFLNKAAVEVGEKLRDRVQVEVTAAGNREPLFNLLRDEIGGRLSEAIQTLEQTRHLSLPQLVGAFRTGAETIREVYRISSAQAERITKASDDVFMKIEELDLFPTTEIQLNTAPAGKPPKWQALRELSKGQKATAVLLLLLLESDAPLIVDQPEDDLDNRFISEDIVPKMREEKRRRQFLFSTHNANIPVLGDAELILGLTAMGEAGEDESREGIAQIEPGHMGSIDSQTVQGLVKDLLEGGKDAFETRRLKYGF
ncbi:MAG: phosphoesterase [Candidatus Poribacteria bacterium]|nr:phosphoesterase [Candidatus Poribacteria bacterium]